MRKKRIGSLLALLVLLVTVYIYYPVKQPSLPDDFLLIAHRGASAYAPEHTLSAYQIAFDLEADYLEIDLQQTKDGILVGFHDDTLKRTTTGTGSVSDYTYAELKNLDAGSWFNEAFPERSEAIFEGETIVKLADIFDMFGQEANYYIETKQPFTDGEMEHQLIQLLEEYALLDNVGDEKQVILQSFNEDSLLTLNELHSDIPLIRLFNFSNQPAELGADEWARLSSYASGIGINQKALTTDFGESVTDQGLMLHVYTVNTYREAIAAYNKGAEGIFTDDLLEFTPEEID